jgi:phosphatidylglycerophosphate synthase
MVGGGQGMKLETSWGHLSVRPLARPLIRLGVKPNQITAASLVVGLAAVGAIAWGSTTADIFAGLAWLVACMLDRLDGEVARLGDMCTPGGHKFDCFVDTALSSLYFPALGIGLRHAPHPYGWIAVGCGLVAGVSQLTLSLVAEAFDSQSDEGKILSRRWGFDPDDALALLGPLLWLPVAVRLGAVGLAALATSGFLLLFLHRLAGLKRRLAAGAVGEPAA